MTIDIDLNEGLTDRGKRIYGQIERARADGFDLKAYGQRMTHGCEKRWIGGSSLLRNDHPLDMNAVMRAVGAARKK